MKSIRRGLRLHQIAVSFGFFLLLGCFSRAAFAAEPKPDFGPNVLVFDPPCRGRNSGADRQGLRGRSSTASSARSAMHFSFCPANTRSMSRSASTPKCIGLGASPDAVHITGNVHSDASLPHNNATCTFWRAAEGFSVTPAAQSGTMQWAVSQAVPFRRMHVLGDIVLHQNRGWASGGWMSDSLIDGNVGSGTQQQWISRNSEWGSWTGANWNMVFVGVPHLPAGEWPNPPYTKVAETPVVREKPFLDGRCARQLERPRSFARSATAWASHGTAAQRQGNQFRSAASTSPTPDVTPQPAERAARAGQESAASPPAFMSSPNPSASRAPIPS